MVQNTPTLITESAVTAQDTSKSVEGVALYYRGDSFTGDEDRYAQAGRFVFERLCTTHGQIMSDREERCGEAAAGLTFESDRPCHIVRRLVQAVV